MLIEPIPKSTLHLVIDMQRLFAEETAWHTPAIQTILPNVVRLSRERQADTLFVKFIVPQRAEDAKGRWKSYYRRWSMVTGEALAPGMLDLVEPLAALAGTDSQVEKETFSVFGVSGFAGRLEGAGIDTLVFSGVETDVCVHASVLDAIDLGFRVIVAADAVASGDKTAHTLVLEHLLPRFAEQLEIATTQAILDAWAS
ncbi:cysteine hydrolase [Rhizobium herbae]|uniref:Nicotinamidase-related amidase n=1 Tax=Rhizobium herbae TaxID=508661 RepID=A0ABS4EIP5_9HYPH|nr:cysteine hydrolase [Rhizobium herbae]MBP1857824.1 nicotinamidase-related amidase [Rhizobium herbae]